MFFHHKFQEFQCRTINCKGLRYKRSLNKQEKWKYPHNKFHIADIKTSLKIYWKKMKYGM